MSPRRSTVVLTPDYFGNFTFDVPLDSLYYQGQKIEADALISNSGAVLAYQPKGDITGLPDFIEPHEISFNEFPPAPKANSKARIALTKDGVIA